nr:hypothetical protein CFP56_70806 [Quercus suber]
MSEEESTPCSRLRRMLLRIAPDTERTFHQSHTTLRTHGFQSGSLVRPTEPPIVLKKFRRELATALSAFLECASNAIRPAAYSWSQRSHHGQKSNQTDSIDRSRSSVQDLQADTNEPDKIGGDYSRVVMACAGYNLPREKRADTVRTHHGKDDQTGYNRTESSDVLQILWDVEQIGPIHDAVQGTLNQDQIGRCITLEESDYGERSAIDDGTRIKMFRTWHDGKLRYFPLN